MGKDLKEKKQQHDYTCGQACVAMIADVEYDDVISTMGLSTTDTKELHMGLKKFGVRSDRLLNKFIGNRKYPEYRSLDFDAVLKMTHKTSRGSYHWVVWDAENQMILDPRRSRAYTIGPAHRITSYLRVWR